MTSLIREPARTREASAAQRDEPGLDAQLFEVEPRDEQWQLKAESAVAAEGAWKSTTLRGPKDMLLTSQDDASIRQCVLAEWRGRLVACKLREQK